MKRLFGILLVLLLVCSASRPRRDEVHQRFRRPAEPSHREHVHPEGFRYRFRGMRPEHAHHGRRPAGDDRRPGRGLFRTGQLHSPGQRNQDRYVEPAQERRRQRPHQGLGRPRLSGHRQPGQGKEHRDPHGRHLLLHSGRRALPRGRQREQGHRESSSSAASSKPPARRARS